MEKTKSYRKKPHKNSTINLKNLPPIPVDPSLISPVYQDKFEDPSSRNGSHVGRLSSREGTSQQLVGFHHKESTPRDADMADKFVLRQNMKVEEDVGLSNLSSSSNKDLKFNKENQKCGHTKAKLHQLCAANHWKLPLYECCKEEGPSHLKLFTFKVIVEIKEENASATILESFGNPHSTKKMAAEHAAEGALWYLRHLGFSLQN
ncbi:Double-stranded RNA-binding protein [Corchorus olitorius]|uniref:Double-stranded RNA-binding protein n=1 Tax=Corchorus olitorius TaxID=93759 RepID=A0A1R3HUZ4_9ROSI|nr:Double-stranded RNA-binding protein [Corchorus olitorius]